MVRKYWVLTLVAILVLAVSGCSTSASTSTPTPAPSPTTLPAFTPTPTPTPVQPIATCNYVASKNSDVFHHPWCSYVQAIKPENKICFSTREEAIGSGRRPCSVCKP
jgi:curli biogenesis system outer membrane secretion channel CsgG